MTAAPTVSVLLPVYNAAPYLAAAIDSVLVQSYTDFELLILNDGSTDHSREIAARYTDPRIRLLDNPHNMGLIATLNRGLELARGSYIARQDGDDIWYAGWLEYALSYLHAHPGVVLVGARAALIDPQDQPIHTSFMPYMALDSVAVRWYLLFETPFAHSNVVYRRDLAAHTLGGYDPAYPHAEDYDLWSRMAQHGDLVLLDEEYSAVRKSQGSVTARFATRERDSVRPVIARNLRSFLHTRDVPAAWLELILAFREARSTTHLTNITAFAQLVELLLARFERQHPGARTHRQIRAYAANLLARAAYYGAAAEPQAARQAYLRAIQYDPAVVRRIPWWKFAGRWLGGDHLRAAYKTAQMLRQPRADRPIAFFVPSLDQRYGGAERATMTFANMLAKRGYAIDLVLIQPAAALRADVDPAVRLVDLNLSRRGLLALPWLWWYVRVAQPAIMVGTLPADNLVSLWAAWLARATGAQRVRVVMQYQNPMSSATQLARPLTRRLLPFLMRLCYPRADAIVSVSHDLASEIRASLRHPFPQLRVIHNPVVRPDVATLAAQDLDDPWVADRSVPLLLGVGRLAPQKDFATLLRAVALVQQQRAVRLLILGEGGLRAELEALVQQLGLAAAVRLPGYVSNPYAYMGRADLFVLSSQSEGLPTVLIEAMACGTPVVATDCETGPREILADGQFGRLVAMGDAVALAKAIGATLDDPLPSAALQARASQFSVAAALAAYEQLLHDLLPDEGA